MASKGDGDRLLTVTEVCQLTKISRAMVYTEMSAGRFPRPVRLGTKAVRWRVSDLDQWIESLPSATGDIGRK